MVQNLANLIQILGVLSQDGIMRFINTESCKLLFDIGSLDNKIYNASISPVGRHIVAVTENGTMTLYDVAALWEDINRVNVAPNFRQL